MTPILATGSRRKDADGFTLVELMVVLIIIVVMSLIVAPSLVGYQAGAQLRSASRQTIAVLNYARARAIAQRQPAVVEFNLEENTMRVLMPRPVSDSEPSKKPGSSVEGLPAGLESLLQDQPLESNSSYSDLIEDGSTLGRQRTVSETVRLVSIKEESSGSSTDQIIFYPDGTATGVEVVLQNQRGTTQLVQVDSLSGRPQLEETEVAR